MTNEIHVSFERRGGGVTITQQGDARAHTLSIQIEGKEYHSLEGVPVEYRQVVNGLLCVV